MSSLSLETLHGRRTLDSPGWKAWEGLGDLLGLPYYSLYVRGERDSKSLDPVVPVHAWSQPAG